MTTLSDPEHQDRDTPMKRTIEAALFTAGKPVPIHVLASLANTSKGKARDALNELSDEYSDRDSAVEVREVAGDKWIMQISPRYAESVMGLAPREMSRPLLRTLSVIAYRQPVTQSEIVELRGNTAYSHIDELVDLDFITTEPHGRTKLLTTTREFSEYFGIDGTDPDTVRAALEEKADRGLFDQYV